MIKIKSMPRYRFYNSFKNYYLIIQYLVEIIFKNKKNYILDLKNYFTSKFDIKFAIPVPQNRYGIYLLMKNVITEKKPYVILPAYTIHDVVNMVLLAGGKPLFVDIEEDTLNICPNDLEVQIHDNVSAVLVTHLHGCLSNIDKIKSICEKNKVFLVEDSAQSFGAFHNGKMNICNGVASVFSFGRAKNINSFFGGMIVTNDLKLKTKIQEELNSKPFESNFNLFKRATLCLVYDFLTLPLIFSFVTINLIKLLAFMNNDHINKLVQTENNPKIKKNIPKKYEKRFSNMQSKLVLSQLDQIKTNTSKRIKIAKSYFEALENISDITMPPKRLDGSHVYMQFPILIKDRTKFVKYMLSNGADIPIQHLKDVSSLKIFSDYSRRCKNSNSIHKKVVLLPTYPGYRDFDVKKNIRLIKNYFLSNE